MIFGRAFTIGAFSVLALSAVACRIQIEEAKPDGGGVAQQDVDGGNPSDINAQIVDVSVVGTSVTSAFHTDGSMAVTFLPKNAAHEIVVGDGVTATVKFNTPPGILVESTQTECVVPTGNVTSSAVGVVLDDSHSMVDNDPESRRKSAAVNFLEALGADDSAMLTDYGNSGSHLRDLLCVKNGGTNCSPATASFTRDKAKLIAATDKIEDGSDGTPLYESCVEMVGIVDTVRDQRRGILLLSDGQPSSMREREACHNAAKTAGIPVFTVGLGPAAESDPKIDVSAVKVLRELASETGGSYASANDPTQLDHLFANIGTALARGSCRTTLRVKTTNPIAPGVTIAGEISVGGNGAKASFTLVAPAR